MKCMFVSQQDRHICRMLKGDGIYYNSCSLCEERLISFFCENFMLTLQTNTRTKTLFLFLFPLPVPLTLLSLSNKV